MEVVTLILAPAFSNMGRSISRKTKKMTFCPIVAIAALIHALLASDHQVCHLVTSTMGLRGYV